MVSMTSCRGGGWATKVCCCSSQQCHCFTSSRTTPSARERALGSPQSRSSAALRLLCPTSVSPASSTTASADVPSSAAATPTALRRAWPSRFNVSSTRPAPNNGVESKAARSCLAPNPPVCSAKATVRSNRTLSKSWAMRPHAKVEQCPWAEGGLLSVETVQHHLPAFVHHGECHSIPITHVTVRLQQGGEGQHPRLHRRFTVQILTVSLCQRLLERGIQQGMALLAQKDKELPSLPGTDGNLLFFRGQRDWGSTHNKLLKDTGSLYPIRAQAHRFVDPLSPAARAIDQRSRGAVSANLLYGFGHVKL